MPRHPCQCSARPLVQMSSDPAGFVISKSNACSDSGQLIDHCIESAIGCLKQKHSETFGADMVA